MDPIEALIAAAGTHRGRNTLHDPTTGQPETTPSVATVTPILAGRFVRLDYTWAYRGAPQEGSLLIGFDPGSGVVSGHWVDTWHMGRQVMACLGPTSAGVITVQGSYPAPPGPDWGWRIDVATAPLRIRHTNITPDGEEMPAVEGVYRD